MSEPHISVVTPCLNRAATIEAAISSVLAQRHPAFEHIVIDGGSTDGTLELLARYPHLVVVQETDRNLYDAINKGLLLARGDIIGILNSDDLYPPGAFRAVDAALADPTLAMVIGAAEFFAEEGGRDIVQRRLVGSQAVGLSEANVINDVTVMNSAFFRRSLLQDLHGFDDRFPLASDKDFWMRLVLMAPRHVVLDQVLYRYRSHPGSLTFAAGDTRDKLSRHLLEVARTRLGEYRRGTAAHEAYRRWHAWAVGYRTMVLVRTARAGTALSTAAGGFSTDPSWVVRFLAMLPRHWEHRGVRRGTLEEPTTKALLGKPPEDTA